MEKIQPGFEENRGGGGGEGKKKKSEAPQFHKIIVHKEPRESGGTRQRPDTAGAERPGRVFASGGGGRALCGTGGVCGLGGAADGERFANAPPRRVLTDLSLRSALTALSKKPII